MCIRDRCLERAHYLADRVREIPGVTLAHKEAPYFREFVLRLPAPAESFTRAAVDRKILAGIPLAKFDRSRPNDLLVAVTEKRSKEDLDRYVEALASWAKSH